MTSKGACSYGQIKIQEGLWGQCCEMLLYIFWTVKFQISARENEVQSRDSKPLSPEWERSWTLLSFHLCHRLLTTPTGRTTSLSGRLALTSATGGLVPDLTRAAYLSFSSMPPRGSLAKEMKSQFWYHMQSRPHVANDQRVTKQQLKENKERTVPITTSGDSSKRTKIKRGKPEFSQIRIPKTWAGSHCLLSTDLICLLFILCLLLKKRHETAYNKNIKIHG